MRPHSWIWQTLLFLLAGYALAQPLKVEAIISAVTADTELAGSALRFLGNGVDDIDRVKIQIDNPDNNDPVPPAD